MYTVAVRSLSPTPPLPSGVISTLTRDGEKIVVEKNVIIAETLRHAWQNQRSLSITLHSGARATVFVNLLPASGERMLNVTLAEESFLRLIVLTQSLQDARLAQFVSVGRNAQSHLLNVTLGGKGLEQNVIAKVEGEGGISTIDWVFHALEDEEQKFSVRNVFAAKNGGGEITVRGIAEDKAHVRCNGMIEIGEGGGGTNTYLTQNVLMLDASAKVDAVPGLEIKTNDVKASHSATVTKVSEEELFYFASRGITSDEARWMYIRGFLKDLLGMIEDGEVRKEIEEAMEARMKQEGRRQRS